jgi:hypothetical protein
LQFSSPRLEARSWPPFRLTYCPHNVVTLEEFIMTAAGPQPGQPVVFRNATMLTMDDSHTVLTNADVLVSGERIATELLSVFA